ncbi:uncharacterized protein LOC131065282 [Cryptomeria japonica]|uniref:uncharacterized protein LOC131065282 n=1 Tax=Cryptomeria japonica TaxID=3369 RepID=UPI0027DA3B5A|nr:uncharacterized protein LOC131065282 [Cryptomeria japonica]
MVDKSEERFDTYKEKSLDLHCKFKKPEIQRKVRKEVEQLVENMGITKEVVRREREKNILKEEDMVRPKKAKPEASVPKPKQSKGSAPSSNGQKLVNSPKPQAKSSSEVKRKQGQARVLISNDEEEIESDDAVKEKKKIVKAAKVVKGKSSSKEQSHKKTQSYEIVMTIRKVKETIVKEGNLKPISKYYELLDDVGKRSIKKTTIEYLNKYNRPLIEIMSEIRWSLYDIMDMRKETARIEEERIREYILVQLCPMIEKAKIDRILEENEKKFRSKKRVNKIMIGRNEGVGRETKQILRAILSNNNYEMDKPILEEDEDEGDKINVDVGDVDKVDSEESEVKVATEARDTEDPIKGKEIYVEDPEFSQGPISLASLSPIKVLKLVVLSQAKASEDGEKYCTNRRVDDVDKEDMDVETGSEDEKEKVANDEMEIEKKEVVGEEEEVQRKVYVEKPDSNPSVSDSKNFSQNTIEDVNPKSMSSA